MQIAAMQNQLAGVQGEIAALKVELSGLEAFRQQVAGERMRFEAQLVGKRAFAARARAVSNARVAEGLASLIDERLGSAFLENVGGCYQGVVQQVDQVISEVEDEIRQLSKQAADIQEDIADERRRIQEEKAREADER